MKSISDSRLARSFEFCGANYPLGWAMLCCGRLALAPCYCPGGDWAHGGTPTHTHDQALWDPPWAVAIAGLGKWPQPGRVWQALGGWGRAPPHAKRAFDGTEVVHGIGHPLGVIPTNAHGHSPMQREPWPNRHPGQPQTPSQQSLANRTALILRCLLAVEMNATWFWGAQIFLTLVCSCRTTG